MNALLPDLIAILGPLLVAGITYYAVDGLSRASDWIDSLHPHLKRGVVLAIASVITLAASKLAIALPTDLNGWDPTTIDALVSAVLAMATKAGATAKDAKLDAQDVREALG